MTREEFMNIVYLELHSDGDNNRANRIIDAADEFEEESIQATIDQVLEIIDKDKEGHAKYDKLLNPMWLRGCFDTLDYLRKMVLTLKGGEMGND